MSNALGVHAAVVSSDGKLIVYKRSALVAECPGCYDVCGGHVEPEFDCFEGIPDPFHSIRREIGEEMGIQSEELVSVVCLGLAQNTSTFKPDLIFAVQARQASSTLLGKPLSDEHANVQALDNNETSIQRFLRRHATTIAPAGRAALVLQAGLGPKSPKAS
jgi:hypothetical protein